MAKVQIAKRLINKYPELAAKHRCLDLVKMLDAFDKRDNTSWVGFSKDESLRNEQLLSRQQHLRWLRP
jgi:hypothetical protein